jgi:hypothetical protein
MRLGPLAGYFALAGAILPITLVSGLRSIGSALGSSGAHQLWLVTVLFWPSSVMMMGTETLGLVSQIEALLISMAANALVYALMGVAVWYGMHRHRIALIVPILAMGVLWRWLTSL